MAKGDRNLGWPGFFRVFTVLCVILLLLSREGLDASPNRVLSIYEGLTCWAVPALFLLWGMFALEQGRSQVSASLLGLALPTFCLLVFWGAVYAVAAHLLGGGALSWGGVWSALVSAARGNTYYHLWVLYPLIGLYLVHPVLQRFTSSASRGEILYFLGLCFLFGSLLPLWSALRPESVIAAQLKRLDVHLVLGWVGCYVGGWYLRHYTISRLSEFALYILGALGLALSLTSPGGLTFWRRYDAPNVLLTAAALCTLFRYVLGVSEERSRRRAMDSVGAYAFGAYLVYPLWALVLRWLGVLPLPLPQALAVPLLALVLFLLSLPFAWLMGHIPKVGPTLT